MTGLKICASIVNDDLEAVRRVEPLVDLYEVRIDLIGSEWREVAGQLKKPWIACNRKSDEGGTWRGGEEARIAELLNALELDWLLWTRSATKVGSVCTFSRGALRLDHFHTTLTAPVLSPSMSTLPRWPRPLCALLTRGSVKDCPHPHISGDGDVHRILWHRQMCPCRRESDPRWKC